MTRKIWFCTLLTVLVLALSCNKETKEVKPEIEEVKSETGNTKTEETIAKVEKRMVKLETSMGDIVIELNEDAAPVTVKNFLSYVEDGFFDGTIFHRVINGFMIQAGGFTAQMQKKQTKPPIVNEASNGLKNDRGAVAMARTNNPDSATSQFFINHKNNDSLNYVENGNPGYAVFGKTVKGMDIVDAIAAVKTTTRMGMQDVPVEPVVINSAKVVTE